MQNGQREIAIIGGGPAGMMGAIYASQNGALVTLFEKNDRLGKKLAITAISLCPFCILVLLSYKSLRLLAQPPPFTKEANKKA